MSVHWTILDFKTMILIVIVVRRLKIMFDLKGTQPNLTINLIIQLSIQFAW